MQLHEKESSNLQKEKKGEAEDKKIILGWRSQRGELHLDG